MRRLQTTALWCAVALCPLSVAQEKETAMVTNRSAPPATVVPILIYDDVSSAIDWLCSSFGFEERLRAPGRDGTIIHAQLAVDEGAVMLGKAGGPFTAHADKPNQYVHVTVTDVAVHFARALAHGAEIVEPPTTMPFGERQYTAKDHAGHWWTFSQHVADVAPEDWGAVPATHAR
jgi:uncharacterized glyoxalase superfamily protein PhnB